MQNIRFEWSEELLTRYEAATPEERAMMKREADDFPAYYEAHRLKIESRSRSALLHFLCNNSAASDDPIAKEALPICYVEIADLEQKRFKVLFGLPVNQTNAHTDALYR